MKRINCLSCIYRRSILIVVVQDYFPPPPRNVFVNESYTREEVIFFIAVVRNRQGKSGNSGEVCLAPRRREREREREQSVLLGVCLYVVLANSVACKHAKSGKSYGYSTKEMEDDSSQP